MNKKYIKGRIYQCENQGCEIHRSEYQDGGQQSAGNHHQSRENFDAKFDYYMEAYDDDLILIAAKGKKDIRIVAAGHGNRFEDIENQLIGEKGKRLERIDCRSD